MRGFLIAILLVSIHTVSSFPHFPFFFPNISSVPPGLPPNVSDSGWAAFRNFTGKHAGDKFNGLDKLKKYFQAFGYIDFSSSSNFTDDFDHALQEAIKSYQRNFHLNVTGELDDATLNQIVLPRCGNPDVVNGSNTMDSRHESVNTSKLHTVGRYTFFPNTPRWPESKYALTYAFHPDNQLSDTVKSVFARAFARWSDVTPLTFTVMDSYTSADLKIAFFNGDHGDGEPFDGALGTLAHAFSPTNGRLHLDGDESWVVEGDVSTSTLTNAVDLESVAIHEIGHLLGLGHSAVEGAIMYPTILAGSRKVELDKDDVNGVQHLYGTNPTYNGSTPMTPTTSIPEMIPKSNALSHLGTIRWGFGFLLAVGFVFNFL